MDLFELAEYNAQLPDPAPSAYLSGYCFSAMYALELLTAGYGFPEEDSPITVVDDVNGTEVTWALGSIVYHANALGWELLPPAAAAATTTTTTTTARGRRRTAVAAATGMPAPGPTMKPSPPRPACLGASPAPFSSGSAGARTTPPASQE